MRIKLVQQVPKGDGYYLVKFSPTGGLHLILLQTELDGRRVIISDACPFRHLTEKKDLKCSSQAVHLFFHDFPEKAWWSEEPIYV